MITSNYQLYCLIKFYKNQFKINNLQFFVQFKFHKIRAYVITFLRSSQAQWGPLHIYAIVDVERIS